MDCHVKEYFRSFSDKAPEAQSGAFHKVIALHEAPDLVWREISKLVPELPKGWFELVELFARDRIDLLRDFWLSQLPFCPHIVEKLDPFFDKIDDIGVFLVQRSFDDPWKAEMVYSVKDNGGFFRGNPPASDEQLYHLQKQFDSVILPEDYMAFLKIHNGFSKATDTGILPVEKMRGSYLTLQEFFEVDDAIFTTDGTPVNPKSLIPFYESFGMPFYQCFWSEWYPESEMGNVYCSANKGQISNVSCSDPNSDQMAFNTFADWLFFYLETVS